MRIMQVMAGANTGGAEAFFVNLAGAFQRAGLKQEVVIRENQDRIRALADQGVTARELPFGGLLDFKTTPALRQIAQDFAPDVVLCWMSRASKAMPTGPYPKLARIGGYYKIKYYRDCDALIFNAPGLQTHLENQGWPAAKSHMIPNYSPLPTPPAALESFPDEKEALAVERSAIRQSLATPDDAKVLLALGRLHPVKAHDVLLKAMVQEPRAWLWLCGEGPEQENLIQLTQNLGLESRVRFLGWRDDKSTLFRASDICVHPSRSEPFGNVVPEAWVHQRPLIATDAEGPAHFMTAGTDGLIVPKDDAAALAQAITQLIDRPDLTQQLVAGGLRSYQAAFTEEACVSAYLELFKSLQKASQA
ncbi:glycosyltransferase [Rhodovibrionaceae bacterium A322]